MRFELAEIPRLLTDSAVASFSAAAANAVFVGSALPLKTTAVREAAFAASTQGLACRLALLPDLDALPGPLAIHIRSEAEQTALRGRKIVERLREVLEILASVEADAIPLKGSALILRGDVGASLRPMGDLDLLLLDPSRVEAAAEALQRATRYRRLLSTARHLVLAEEGERVAAPGAEHPDNPIRIELHRSFRLPVLGMTLDATEELRRSATKSADGFLLIGDGALFRHLWHHAAEDFAARGLRGIQAVDFLDLARRRGPLIATLDPRDSRAAAPLLYAADAIERLFPGTFDRASLDALSGRVPPALRARASALPVLRHTRPAHGWSRISLHLAPGFVPKTRFLVRTAFPSPGEVKANVAPGATGVRLAFAYVRVLAKRAVSLLRP